MNSLRMRVGRGAFHPVLGCEEISRRFRRRPNTRTQGTTRQNNDIRGDRKDWNLQDPLVPSKITLRVGTYVPSEVAHEIRKCINRRSGVDRNAGDENLLSTLIERCKGYDNGLSTLTEAHRVCEAGPLRDALREAIRSWQPPVTQSAPQSSSSAEDYWEKDRKIRAEVAAEDVAEKPVSRPSFWKRLFSSGSKTDLEQALKKGPTVQADSPAVDYWSGPIVSQTDPAVKDPRVISDKDDLMQASANVVGAQRDGLIRLLARDGKVIGIWVKAFPDNATKKAFLSMYCATKIQSPGDDTGITGFEDAQRSFLLGRFEIYKDLNHGGFNIRLL